MLDSLLILLLVCWVSVLHLKLRRLQKSHTDRTDGLLHALKQSTRAQYEVNGRLLTLLEVQAQDIRQLRRLSAVVSTSPEDVAAALLRNRLFKMLVEDRMHKALDAYISKTY